jgi:hypothetical protein
MKRLYERYCQEDAKLLQLVAVLQWGLRIQLSILSEIIAFFRTK